MRPYDFTRPPADVDGPHGLPVPVRAGILPPAPVAAALPASSMRKLCEHAADALGLLVDDRRHVAGTVLGVGKLGPVAADLLRRRRAEAHDALAALALATVDTDPALAAAASERAGAVAGWRDMVADDEAWRAIYAAMGAERPTDPGMPWLSLTDCVETDPTYRDDPLPGDSQ